MANYPTPRPVSILVKTPTRVSNGCQPNVMLDKLIDLIDKSELEANYSSEMVKNRLQSIKEQLYKYTGKSQMSHDEQFRSLFSSIQCDFQLNKLLIRGMECNLAQLKTLYEDMKEGGGGGDKSGEEERSYLSEPLSANWTSSTSPIDNSEPIYQLSPIEHVRRDLISEISLLQPTRNKSKSKFIMSSVKRQSSRRSILWKPNCKGSDVKIFDGAKLSCEKQNISQRLLNVIRGLPPNDSNIWSRDEAIGWIDEVQWKK